MLRRERFGARGIHIPYIFPIEWGAGWSWLELPNHPIIPALGFVITRSVAFPRPQNVGEIVAMARDVEGGLDDVALICLGRDGVTVSLLLKIEDDWNKQQ